MGSPSSHQPQGPRPLLGSGSSFLETETPQMTPSTAPALSAYKVFAPFPLHNNPTFNKQCQRHRRKTRDKNKAPHRATTSASCLEDRSPTATALSAPDPKGPLAEPAWAPGPHRPETSSTHLPPRALGLLSGGLQGQQGSLPFAAFHGGPE